MLFSFCSNYHNTKLILHVKELKPVQRKKNLFTLLPLLTKLLLFLPTYTTDSLASAFSTQGVGMHICPQHRQPVPTDADKKPQSSKAPKNQPKMQETLEVILNPAGLRPLVRHLNLFHSWSTNKDVSEWCFSLRGAIIVGAISKFLQAK